MKQRSYFSAAAAGGMGMFVFRRAGSRQRTCSIEEAGSLITGKRNGNGRRRKKWRKQLVSILAGVVVFATTYALILPAITLDENTAAAEPGIELSAAAAPAGHASQDIVMSENTDVSDLTLSAEAAEQTPQDDS